MKIVSQENNNLLQTLYKMKIHIFQQIKFQFNGMYDQILQKYTLELINTNQIEIKFKGQNLVFNNSGQIKKFNSQKIAFKFPSEHYLTLYGRTNRYPLEMQIYFINQMNEKAIVSFLFSDDNEFQNDFLQSIGIDMTYQTQSELIQQMEQIQRLKKAFDIKSFETLIKLIQYDNSLFYYKGSMTTPDCQENVDWFIFKNERFLNEKQMNFFRNLLTFLRTDTQTNGDENIFEGLQSFYGNNRVIQDYDVQKQGYIKEIQNGICKMDLNFNFNQ